MKRSESLRVSLPLSLAVFTLALAAAGRVLDWSAADYSTNLFAMSGVGLVYTGFEKIKETRKRRRELKESR